MTVQSISYRSKPLPSTPDPNTARSSRDRNSEEHRSASGSRQAHMHESNHFNPSRGRRDASLNRNGSESSTRRDFYGQEAASRSTGNVKETVDGRSHNDSVKGNRNMDEENWIHRDKLARIESEELHQAAILFQRRFGTESRSSRAKGQESPQTHVPGSFPTTPMETPQSEPWPNLREDQRDYIGPSAPADGDDSFEPTEEERQNWDLRRPEEIAADGTDDGASNIYQNPALRKSSSRIPLSKASPMPISPDQAGREYRKPRSRGLTNGSEDSPSSMHPRRASEPGLVDSAGVVSTPSTSRPASRGTPSGQSITARKTSRGTPGSTNRKTSAPPTTRKTTTRNRAVSGNSPAQRPSTRSGETRPSTAVNRPEGDPPWLATMYKPDPRLPPDQQMLPTHARKMQQEQWAKEGKVTTTYDRDFAPLVVRPDEPPRPIEKTDKDDEKKDEQIDEKSGLKTEETQPRKEAEAAWPLAPPKSEEPPIRPTTSTGYSTIPKVQGTPPLNSTPNWNPPVVTAQEEEPKSKGCGCCTVM